MEYAIHDPLEKQSAMSYNRQRMREMNYYFDTKQGTNASMPLNTSYVYKMTRLTKPTKLCYISEGRSSSSPLCAWNAVLADNSQGGTKFDFRHNKRINVLFADGHVESRTLKEIPFQNDGHGNQAYYHAFWKPVNPTYDY